MGPKRLWLPRVLALALLCAAGIAVLWLGSTLGQQARLVRRSLGPQPQAAEPQIVANYGKLPLSFEANQGQAEPQVKFLSRGQGYTLFLTGTEAVLALNQPQRTQRTRRESFMPSSASSAVQLRLRLLGANPQPEVRGVEELPGKSNYFIGNDPSKWRTNVPTYGKVEYRDVYPGVNLVHYGNQRQLEYDFVVSPGADPSAIKFEVEGAERIEIDEAGDLVMQVAGGEVRQHKPIVYQQIAGQRRDIPGRFVLTGETPHSAFRTPHSHEVGFEVGSYDASQPLVVDPVLVYSTYLGGGGIGYEYGTAIAVDSAGNAYVTGYTNSTNFPTGSPLQAANGGGYDIFVAKLNTAGSALVYSTYLGGSGDDRGNGIAVDSAGNAYVTGYTGSTNFPTASPLQAAYGGGSYDAFVTKLNAAGSALVYSTYLGGSGTDQGNGTAVDSSGNAYVTGWTGSTNFPTVSPLQAANGGYNAYVAKLNAAGSALVYSTCLGGSGDGSGLGIAVDSAGNAYVTGVTAAANFPTASPLQATFGGNYDAFVAKLNAAGSALIYSTYLGGSGVDYGCGIAVDSSGNAYVTGRTSSSNFPTASPLQAAKSGVWDAFVAKLNAAGSTLVYSTYLGGTGDDLGYAIAVDPSGNAYVTGSTSSTNFPTVSPLQTGSGAGGDVFVAKLNAAGSALVYSTYLGGSGFEYGYGIAVDSSGNAYVTGETGSTYFPVANAFQPVFGGGGYDAFVAKISGAAGACAYSIVPASQAFTASAAGGSVAVTAAAGCTWTAASAASWITITSGSSGSGSGTVAYSVAANTNTSSRTGTLTIAGQTFTVNQAGVAACSYAIAPASASAPAGGTTGSVTVTAPSGCTWTATSNASWITITSGSSGSGNGTVNYTVAANSSASSQTGTLTIAGQTFTVNQAAATCSYAIAPASASAPAGGTTGSVTVTAPTGCTWTAASTASWITITSGSGGSGNGTVNYTVAANSSASSQTGTLTIAGQTFTVNQAGATCSYAIAPGSASAPAGGTTGSVTVTAPTGCTWTAASTASWITLTAGSSGSSNGTVNYTVAANSSASSQTGTLTIAGQTFTVNQAGATCSYAIAPASASAPAGGTTGSVTVTAPTGCTWTAASTASWITITLGASGSGNGTVNYTVAANSSASSQAGTLTIAGQTFTVNQAAATCSYAIAPTSASVQASGGTGSVAVTAPTGCAWTAASNASWITITSGATGSGNGTVNYSVTANSSGNPLTGTLTIAGQTFTVNQAGATCSYAIAPTSASVQASGGTGSVAVTAPTGCAWTAASTVSWITITLGASGSGNGTVNYTVAANNSVNPLTGTLTIAGQTFTVNQAAATCSYAIAPTSASASASGGTSSVTVTAPTGCAWTAASTASWITITSGATGSGNGTVNYSVTANSSGNPLTGTLTIAGQTFTVNQAGATCSYAITPTSASVQASGGTGSVAVSAPTGCTWTAASTASWITITLGASGSGNGTVNYSVTANSSGNPLTGTLTIAGQTFTVNQAGATCSYAIAPTSASVQASGGTGSVAVTAPTGCTWTAASNASWITITLGASGSGNGTVNYSVTANSSVNPLTGTLTIAGQTFTVNQAAATCSYPIAPTSASVQASGGTGSVTVTAATGCTWTAASNASWITITSGASGSGNGTVSYTVAANTTTTSRAGTLTIAGQTFAVTQTAAATLTVSPTTLSFTAQRGGANPAAQSLQVTASDASSIPWTATSSAAWLTVSAASGNTAANVSVSVNITGLAAGSYTGQVSFVSGGGTPVAVSVSLTVSETAAVIGVSPASLQFTTSAGLNPAPQSITVTNRGGGTLNWAAIIVYTSTAGWLSITPGFGVAPASALVTVDVNAAVLRAGTYQAQILISALGGATNSPLPVPVTLLVTSVAQLAVSPQFLSFQATQGSSGAVTQALSVTNAGSGALNWTASATTSNGGDWLRLSATQGAAPAAITVSANPAGLAAGVYLGSIQITDAAAGGKQSVFVALTVSPPATTILLSQSDFVFTTVESTPGLLKQTLRILNLGQGTLAWKLLATIPSGGNWLAVDQASGSSTTDPATAAPIGVLVNPAGLAAGNYYGLLIASAAGATNSPQLASVHLRVLPSTSAPKPSVLPSGFIFAAAEGGAAPAAQAFSVQNLGGGSLPFKVSVSTVDGAPWLSASPAQATATATTAATIAVQVSAGNLRAGVYRGAISLDFPAGLTQDLSVILVITPAGVSPQAALERPAAGCAPTELQAVSTLLPNNFMSLVGWPVPIMVRVVDNCSNAITGATVVASFLGADYAPLVLRSLRDGLYSGTWVPLSNNRVRVTIKVLSPPLKEATIELLSQPADFTANLPLINPEGVVNGASFDPRTPVAPGSIVSLFGRNLVPQPTAVIGFPLPTNLGGLAVKIGDRDAPLFYANNGQVNAQVPLELADKTAASVVLTMNGKVSPPEPLLLSPVQPGVFAYDDGGVAHAAALDEKNALVGKANPAVRGTVIQVYATGLGPTDPAAKTGEPAPASPPALLKPEIQLTATIGGVPAEIQFKGLAPGYVGLYQVNLKVPSGLPSGDLPLVLTANGLPSKETMLPVK